VRRHVDSTTKLLYGLGAVAFGVKDNGFSFFLLLYYNQVLGLPEAWVGLGIMLALMIDAVVDPVIGHFSDHLHARWGRRHPFMYAAALPVAVVYWLLWNPPTQVPPATLLSYFLGVSVVVRIAISAYEIPSASLVPELTDHYDERTSLISYRFFFGWWGGLGMTVLAYAVFLQPDALHPVGVLNPEGYRHYGLAAAILILLAILVSAVGTHGFIPYLKRPPARGRLGMRGIFRELGETLSNRSFLALFGAGVFAAMGAGLQAALSIYINTYFWELSSNQISVLVLSSFASAVIAFVAAPVLSRRLGKKRAAIGVSLSAVAVGPMPTLGALPRQRVAEVDADLARLQPDHHRSGDHVRNPQLLDGRRHRRGQRDLDRPSLGGGLRGRERLRPKGGVGGRNLRLVAAARLHRLSERGEARCSRSPRGPGARPGIRSGAHRALSDLDRLSRHLPHQPRAPHRESRKARREGVVLNDA
jgi:hypothetical protein